MMDVCNALGAIGDEARPALSMVDDLAVDVRWNPELADAARRAVARIRR